MPYHATTMGKAILAFQPPEFVSMVVQRGLQPFTPLTITEASALSRELEVIRDCGFALNRGEYRAGGLAVAVPLLNASGVAVAAISVPAAKTEMDPAGEVVQSLVALGRTVSLQLGYGETVSDHSL